MAGEARHPAATLPAKGWTGLARGGLTPFSEGVGGARLSKRGGQGEGSGQGARSGALGGAVPPARSAVSLPTRTVCAAPLRSVLILSEQRDAEPSGAARPVLELCSGSAELRLCLRRLIIHLAGLAGSSVTGAVALSADHLH